MTHFERMLILMIAIIAFMAPPLQVQADDDDDVVPGEAIVKLVDGADIDAFARKYRVEVLDEIPMRRTYLLGVPEGDEEEFVDIVVLDPEVERAEPCYTGRDVNPDPGTQSIFVASTRLRYINQYAIARTELNPVHKYIRGEGVLVAVLDSGVDASHPALAPALAPGGWNFIDDNDDIADVGDGLDNDDDDLIDESVGHGTMVAGLVRRFAPSAGILPLKVLDSDGFTTTFRMVEAMYYGMDSGAQILNLSLGTTQETFVIEEAVAEAVARNVLVVACTGNEDTSSPVRFPSALSNMGVIAVSATDWLDRRAEFSNFGEHVTICAPGEAITSTVPGSRFGKARGTSFAAPMVAGAAALILAADPTYTPAEVRRRLYEGANDIRNRNPGYEDFLGAGRLDVVRSLLLQ